MEKIFESEYRFLTILWENEPVTSPKLVELCNEGLGWKKSTTYTEIKRLSEKGYIKNENAVVTPLCTKEEVQAQESGAFMERTFSGSLPQFLTAFLGGRQKLSKREADELKKLIDFYHE